jgi:hypothetical protein
MRGDERPLPASDPAGGGALPQIARGRIFILRKERLRARLAEAVASANRR